MPLRNDCVKLAQSRANLVSTLTHDSYISNDKHMVWELETLSLNLRFLVPHTPCLRWPNCHSNATTKWTGLICYRRAAHLLVLRSKASTEAERPSSVTPPAITILPLWIATPNMERGVFIGARSFQSPFLGL